MAKQKPQQHVALFDGCYRSKFTVHPGNWDSAGASVKTDWYFSYRFYDPAAKDNKYPKGKQVLVKGMNSFKTLMERRQATKALLERARQLVDEQGYNPITDTYMAPVVDDEFADYEIHPDTPLLIALNEVFKKKLTGRPSEINVRSALKYISIAAKQIRYDTLPIKDISKRHIKKLLEHSGKVKTDMAIAEAKAKNKEPREAWSANTYNFYRTTLLLLFDELEDWDAIENNPVLNIAIKHVVRTKRKVLTVEERVVVDKHLREHHYNFWRFMMIFFKSGSRCEEILKVQVKDVDMKNQLFRAIRLKGKSAKEVEYTIVDSAVSLWEEQLQGANPDDYVFSTLLLPGSIKRRRDYISHYWEKHVKKALGIDADFYALKKLHSTAISNLAGTKAAADFNNESEKMIINHYDADYEKRRHNTARIIDIPFVPLDKVK